MQLSLLITFFMQNVYLVPTLFKVEIGDLLMKLNFKIPALCLMSLNLIYP